ncbi:copper amine oxidase N-terminal domain-containing protein [Paenibacillus sp. LHD-38]|uniref:copper amine oxidase N-terminal domain-containing protein n=1 Tax=Paenibacillus sp. LHD-38 TaxID=3072143 RepID=UPI00280D08EF|nr:copper amine oxidase N-terminal domain-containing protein [Paenibacillus sp. LHD-38]MDQ8734396.1 copper amine oxidase N-terminal domain-containing protein [Paenibacillus sp. LHD-38]
MKKWMKTAAAALTVAGVLSAGTVVMASPISPTPVKIFINGLYQDDVLNVNGRTMVQLKAFHDPAKISYSYESATKNIIIKNPVNNITVRLKDGLKTADINGKKIALDAPVTVKRGRTYVPVRFVTERLGGTVAYSNAGKQVIVRTPTGEEQFKTLMSGELDKARVAALGLPELNYGKEIQPYGEGFTTIYTFPIGEALRYIMEYRGLVTYVEVNENGIAEVKWQKDTIGKNGETGQEPKAFGESVYFMNNLMADILSYGTVDSTGKSTELAAIDRYNNPQFAYVLIMPIEGEVRTDAKLTE